MLGRMTSLHDAAAATAALERLVAETETAFFAGGTAEEMAILLAATGGVGWTVPLFVKGAAAAEAALPLEVKKPTAETLFPGFIAVESALLVAAEVAFGGTLPATAVSLSRFTVPEKARRGNCPSLFLFLPASPAFSSSSELSSSSTTSPFFLASSKFCRMRSLAVID